MRQFSGFTKLRRRFRVLALPVSTLPDHKTGNPEIRINFDCLLQLRASLGITTGLMEKHSFERAVEQEDWIQFPRPRDFGNGFLVAP